MRKTCASSKTRGDIAISSLRGRQIAAEGLFNKWDVPLRAVLGEWVNVAQACVAQIGNNLGKFGRTRGEIVEPAAADFEFVFQFFVLLCARRLYPSASSNVD